MGEDVVAPVDTPLFEAERFHQAAQLRESDVAEVATRQSIEKPLLVHVPNANDEH